MEENKHEHIEECHCGCHHEHEPHEHHHEHNHEHHHEHHHEHRKHLHVRPKHHEDMEKKIYILENLGCANCAAKMERKINELPEVKSATITYATKQLAVYANEQESLLPVFNRICASIEPEVKVIPKNEEVQNGKEKKISSFQKHKKEVLSVGAGVFFFVTGLLLEHFGNHTETISAIVFVAAYLILGVNIVSNALKNLLKGHVFDENFLMAVATIAAFAIGDFAEAAGVMLFYRIGELFEDMAVERSRTQIMETVDMRPEVVTLVSGDAVNVVPAKEAKKGDIILVRPGDRIPLDGVVVEGESRLDTSPVTGEPVPVRVCKGKEVISGCVNEQGVLKILVEKPLEESMVSRILESVENAAANKPKMDRFITKFARIYTPVVVATAVITAIVPSLIWGDWEHWIYTAITFLVISCPCALVLSVPLAFFSGIGAASKKGILLKGGAVIEALKEVKVIAMDKTGTVTKGTFVVKEIESFHRLTKKQLLTIAADCELDSTHPIGQSIVNAAKESQYSLVRAKEVEEIAGKGIRAQFPEGEVLCGNLELMKSNGVSTEGIETKASDTVVFIAIQKQLEGKITIGDVIKEEAENAVKRMKSYHLTTVMLTGDTKESAERIAEQIGINEVYAKLLPEEKLESLQKIRKNHGPVMYVGDGINDAPVLAGADVGAAMGSGADAAIEAADVVFMNSSVEAIGDVITIARKTSETAMQNVVFALLVKLLVIILGFLGFANMWMAVFADTGVACICVLNSIRILYVKKA